MNYRTLGRTGLKVSEIGLGGEYLEGLEYEQIEPLLSRAIDAGVNILDVFMPAARIRDDIGRALAGRRDKIMLQGHIGAVMRFGQYARSRSVTECDRYIKDFLKRCNTDYIDVGMMHIIDTDEDFTRAFESGFIEYALRLKSDGVIRFLGASSHNPFTARRIAQTGLVDVLMFSVNPAFDLMPGDTDIDDLFSDAPVEGRFSIAPERAALYSRCEELGVGITVMKTLGAGRLLSDASSPFGMPLTCAQCISYALDRPAVASVLLGVRSLEELEADLACEEASPELRDYSVIARGTANAMRGRCMYCNHCLPCPQEIDVAAVTKYLDMGLSATTRAHYAALPVRAGACTGCGACAGRCPFGVDAPANMRKAQELFGS